MSGGSMDFLYSKILNAEFELNTPERIAFKQHLELVAEACKAIEWVDSGDNSKGSENDAINQVLKSTNNMPISKRNSHKGSRKWYRIANKSKYIKLENGCSNKKPLDDIKVIIKDSLEDNDITYAIWLEAYVNGVVVHNDYLYDDKNIELYTDEDEANRRADELSNDFLLAQVVLYK